MSDELDADVVVVGCGYAGAFAAIAAHDNGARVLVLEKMPEVGGISVCSFGGIRTAENADLAFAYLKRTNGETAPDALLRTLARGMVAAPRALRRLAKPFGALTAVRPSPGNYPFDGYETFGFVTVDHIPGFDIERAYPNVVGAPGGRMLFQLLQLALAARGIVPMTQTPVTRLKTEGGRVVGVEARRGRRTLSIRARRGVVLACGGFEGAPEMQARHWSYGPVANAAFRGNTGDGIRMAQALGAELWHMWHFHGSYGFRHPDPAYPFGIRTKRLPDWTPGTPPRGDVRMPWILLNKRGRRFMNEYDPYMQDTGARPFAAYDPVQQSFSALPAWLVADADGARLWPFGRPTSHERGVRYEWSTDNTAEMANGMLRVAGDVDDLAKGMNLSRGELVRSLEVWNAACAAGQDDAFDRPPTSMVPIAAPPFVYAPVWPIVSNTQGGPVHDARQRILTVDGMPIPGLYAAGELGSLFGHVYMSGGNIAECFVGGTIAGREATQQ